MEGRIALSAEGEFELARAAGFDTYDDFVRWKETRPDEYERWYDDLRLSLADEDDE